MVVRGLTSALPAAIFSGVQDLSREDWRLPPGKELISALSANSWNGRGGHRIRCVVWHITDGSAASALDWLRNPASDASANDLIDREGRIYQLVEGADTPWTNGPVCHPNLDQPVVRQTIERGINPNRVSYTIECAGRSMYWAPGALTVAQTIALIGRTAQACVAYGLTADREHILRHSDWDDCDRHNCPGYSVAEMATWIDAVRWLAYRWRSW